MDFAFAKGGPEEPIECNGDTVEYFKAEKKIIGSGNVVIKYKDATLTCDKVTVWPETKDAEAEGKAKIVQGENIIEGEKIIYNFEKETGKIIEAKVTAPPWYAKGKEGERLSKDKMVVKKGYITTCDHDKPHWRLSAKRVDVYAGKMVTAYNAVSWFRPWPLSFDIPVMWVPWYCHPLDDNRPHVTVIPGKNKRWGSYLLTAWRYDLTPIGKGYVHFDYREKKDAASGIDYIYDTRFFGKGAIKAYYMYERDVRRKHSWHKWYKDDGRKGYEPTKEQEKGLLRIRHQWEVSENTLVTAEMHKYRDENFLKDYFFREYEKDEHPESYVLLTSNLSAANLSLLTKKRMNRFDDTTEVLPEAKLDISSVPLFRTNEAAPADDTAAEDTPRKNKGFFLKDFYYTGNFSATNFHKVYPRYTTENPGTITTPAHNNRYDAYNQLTYKSKLAFLSVNPYAGARQTYYDRETYTDSSQLRGAFYTGLDASTKFFKVFDVKGSPLGMEINRLRHIITPTLSYNYIPPPTMPASKVFQFDSIDGVDRSSTMGLGLENKLQTKRGEDQHIVDLAMLLVSTTYDFRHNPGTQFLDYTAKLELRPYDWLMATSNATIDSHTLYNHLWLKQIGSDLSFIFAEKGSFGIGHRYTAGSNNLVLQAKLDAVPGWRFSIYQDLDILATRHAEKKTRDLKAQEYIITKDLHCWEMEVRYDVDRDQGEDIMLVFRLKAFPEIPFEFQRGYHKPKIGTQAYAESYR